MSLAMKLGKVLDAATAPSPAASSVGGVTTAAVATAPPAAAATSLAAPAASAPASHKSAAVFAAIGEAVARDGKALVGKTKGVFKFIIAPPAPPVPPSAPQPVQPFIYILDLKNGDGKLVLPGGAYDGPPADLEMRVSDDDFVALALGKLNAQQVGGVPAPLTVVHLPNQPTTNNNTPKCPFRVSSLRPPLFAQAFMKGRLKLRGSIPLAMKLSTVLSAARAPPPARL